MFNSFHKLSLKENLFHDIFINDKQIKALHNLVLCELVYINSNILTRSPLYTNNEILMKNFKTKYRKNMQNLFSLCSLVSASSFIPVISRSCIKKKYTKDEAEYCKKKNVNCPEHFLAG